MIKPYESGDFIVINKQVGLWLIGTCQNEHQYIVQNKNGNKIQLDTQLTASRLARYEERKAGRRIHKADDVVCDHCHFMGGKEQLQKIIFDSSLPLTCPSCNGRCFNGGDWLFAPVSEQPEQAAIEPENVPSELKSWQARQFRRKFSDLYRKAKKTPLSANGEAYL